jgi:tetratricopeptide (TPR) repeat protein
MCNTQRIAHRPTRPRGRRSGVSVDSELLRQTRLAAGLSLAQVAGVELTRQAVHLIETGKVRPSMESLEVIAGRLGRPVSHFVDRVAPANRDRRQAEFEELIERHRYPELHEAAVELTGAGGPIDLRAVGHFYAGRALHQLNRYGEALDHLARAEELAGRVRDEALAAEAVEWQAATMHRTGDVNALARAEEALRRYRRLRDRQPEIEGRMVQRVGACLIARCEYAPARARLREALEILGGQTGVRDLEGMGRIYHDLAGCARGEGDLRRAIELMERAVSLYSVEHDLRPARGEHWVPRAENDLGMLLLEVGQLSRAEPLLLSAEARLAAAGAHVQRVHVLLSIGQLRQAQRRLDDGFAAVGEAIELATANRYTIGVAVGHQQLGELHAERGERAAFDEHFRTALDVLGEAGLAERRARCQATYDRLAARLDDRAGGLPASAAGA